MDTLERSQEHPKAAPMHVLGVHRTVDVLKRAPKRQIARGNRQQFLVLGEENATVCANSVPITTRTTSPTETPWAAQSFFGSSSNR